MEKWLPRQCRGRKAISDEEIILVRVFTDSCGLTYKLIDFLVNLRISFIQRYFLRMERVKYCPIGIQLNTVERTDPAFYSLVPLTSIQILFPYSFIISIFLIWVLFFLNNLSWSSWKEIIKSLMTQDIACNRNVCRALYEQIS